MEVNALSKENFSNWGKFVSANDVTNQAQTDSFNYVGNIATALVSENISLSVLEPKERDLVITHLEKHKNTDEICVAIENDCIIVVTTDRNDEPEIDKLQAFSLKQGDTVVYNKNIWHWVPFANGTKTCKQLIVYTNKTGDDDFYMYELDEKINIRK